MRLYGEPLGKAAQTHQDKDTGKEGSSGNFKQHLWSHVSCFFQDWGRFEQAGEEPEQRGVICNYCRAMHIPCVISQGQRQDSGEPGHCLWQGSMLLGMYIDICTVSLRMHKSRVPDLVRTSPLLNLCRMMGCHLPSAELPFLCVRLAQEACYTCTGWLSRWSVQDLLWF